MASVINAVGWPLSLTKIFMIYTVPHYLEPPAEISGVCLLIFSFGQLERQIGTTYLTEAK